MLREAMPKEGERAPAFTAVDQQGRTVKLADLKGKKVALFFYPEDDSPTCTVQVCNLRDNRVQLEQAGYVILGVSPEGAESHKHFAEKFKLPFSLLADADKKIINAYGVWGMKQLYGRTYEGLHRTTFLIDERGMVERVITGVRTNIHTQQILNAPKRTKAGKGGARTVRKRTAQPA